MKVGINTGTVIGNDFDTKANTQHLEKVNIQDSSEASTQTKLMRHPL